MWFHQPYYRRHHVLSNASFRHTRHGSLQIRWYPLPFHFGRRISHFGGSPHPRDPHVRRRSSQGGITPASAPSTSHVTQANPRIQAVTRREERQETLPPRQAKYPPSGGIKWNATKEIFEDKKSYPHCHSHDEFHWTVGCPALVVLNLVYVEDANKAKEITAKITPYKGPRLDDRCGGGRSGRGSCGGCGVHRSC